MAGLAGLSGLPWSRERRVARRRERLAGQAPPGPLRDCLGATLPGPDTPVTQVPALAVDLETTGLDSRTDAILSIGYVPLDGLTIRLGGAGYRVVAQGDSGARSSASGVGQSAAVHGLTDDVVAAGVPLEQAIGELLVALRGRVLLAHFGSIERDFVAAACRSLSGVDLPLPSIDTLELQRRIVGGAEEHVPAGSLRLAAAREHLGLPRYRAHDALTDALACAELYLAQVAHLGRGEPIALRRVLD